MKMGGNRQNYFELCSIQARVQLLREVFPPTSPFNLSAIKHFVKESVFGGKGGGTFQHKTCAIWLNLLLELSVMELSMVCCNQIKIEITDENQPGPKQLLLNTFCKGCPSKDTEYTLDQNVSLTFLLPKAILTVQLRFLWWMLSKWQPASRRI